MTEDEPRSFSHHLPPSVHISVLYAAMTEAAEEALRVPAISGQTNGHASATATAAEVSAVKAESNSPEAKRLEASPKSHRKRNKPSLSCETCTVSEH